MKNFLSSSVGLKKRIRKSRRGNEPEQQAPRFGCDFRKARGARWPLEFLLHRWPHWYLHGFLENIFAGRLAGMMTFTSRFRQYSRWPLKN